MEGTMAEIRMFAAPFDPKYWASCQGQIMGISTNQALFALLGTTYGGNGIQTFALPDFRGRVALGTGAGGNSGITVVQGETGGSSNTTLLISNIPPHTHLVSNAGTVPVTGTATATMAVNNTSSSSSNPKDNYLAVEGGASGLYNNTPTPSATLNAAAISVPSSTLGLNTSSITIAPAGNNIPVNNTMPSLGMNIVICLYGIFPSRN
jgi:microcystin-dependent protein